MASACRQAPLFFALLLGATCDSHASQREPVATQDGPEHSATTGADGSGTGAEPAFSMRSGDADSVPSDAAENTTGNGIDFLSLRPPELPASFDPSSYPDCVGDWRSEDFISEKVDSLRECRGALEYFRSGPLEGYGALLTDYQRRLLQFEARARRQGSPDYERILEYFNGELAKLDPLTGEYRKPYRDYLGRYRRDFDQVERRICRLRRMRADRGC